MPTVYYNAVYVKSSDILDTLTSYGRHQRDDIVALHYKKMEKLHTLLSDIKDLGACEFCKGTDVASVCGSLSTRLIKSKRQKEEQREILEKN